MELFDLEFLLGRIHYFLFIGLMMTGLYIVVQKTNLVKKMIGLSVFQVSVFMFYIGIGKVAGGTAPILPMDKKYHVDTAAMEGILYSNPLPHVLILTAIVVGVATTALGLALIVRIREEFDTVDEEVITEIEQQLTHEDNKKYGNAMGGRA